MYMYILTIYVEETCLDVDRRILGLFRETSTCMVLQLAN